MLAQRIAAYVLRHAMWRPEQTVGVAVSGGADSVALLHLLLDLSTRLHVLHLNHHLRGDESDADAAFVRDLAQRHSLPFTLRDADFSTLKGNLEQAARRARLDFFRDAIASGQVDRVALGHTRSDQAETVLFRFLRGAGTAGLSGIRPTTSHGIVRPLLEINRSELEEYLHQRQIPWREDSSNRDPAFSRNRIRHQLLPQLIREWNPALIDVLSQTADWAREEEAWCEAEIDRLASQLLTRRIGFVLLPADRLCNLPVAAARRLVRRAIEAAKGDLRAIDFSHIGFVLQLAAAQRGCGSVQLPGVTVVRSFDWLRFVAHGAQAADFGYQSAANVPGTFKIPETDAEVRLELIERTETFRRVESVYNDRMGGLDWQRLSGRLEWRNWRAGDRYRPSGSTGEEKLKTLFQQARIPVWERRLWPVLTDGASIVWVKQFGPAAEFEAKSGCRWVLAIHENGSPDEKRIGTGRNDV